MRLVEAVAAAGIDVSADAADAARRLSRHYIPARYPDAHPSGRRPRTTAAPTRTRPCWMWSSPRLRRRGLGDSRWLTCSWSGDGSASA
ncbi:MAG: hypothetical protein ACRDGE_06260 [Candidatus Limnocylindria bacterium]